MFVSRAEVVRMAYRFSDQWIDDLRARVDIVDVVAEYVELKQKGRRFWGRCPFHTEKTPSFSVDSESQMYYCFGCHKGGTVITFVMEMERMEFGEAVEQLAQRAHVPLPEKTEGGGRDSVTHQLRERLYEANREAARFYHGVLWTEEGAQALSYLHRRGLDDAGIRRFGLGATPAGRDALIRHLTEAGYTFDEMKQAGLAAEREGRRYDVFFNRAMFPIINPQGNVLGFGGRALGDGNPKYLNTADTPVFNKRQGMYALNMCKNERGLNRLILVEGYMDVVSLRQMGISGVVATLGTALTEEQARLFKRYAPQVWVCYDGDGAGQKAILRALDIFEALDYPARVIDIPDGMDPDEYVRKYGAEGFEALKPIAPAEYRMLRAEENYDLTDDEARLQYAIACCAILRKVKNPVELDSYLSKLSVKTGVDTEVLMRQVRINAPPQEAQAAQRPPRTFNRRVERSQTPEHVRAEQLLVNLMANRMIGRETLDESAFVTPLYVKLARQLAAGEAPAAILERMESEERDEAAQALMMESQLTGENVASAVSQCLQKIDRYRKEVRIPELLKQIREETSPERRAELMSLLNQLSHG